MKKESMLAPPSEFRMNSPLSVITSGAKVRGMTPNRLAGNRPFVEIRSFGVTHLATGRCHAGRKEEQPLKTEQRKTERLEAKLRERLEARRRVR